MKVFENEEGYSLKSCIQLQVDEYLEPLEPCCWQPYVFMLVPKRLVMQDLTDMEAALWSYGEASRQTLASSDFFNRTSNVFFVSPDFASS